VTTASHSIQKFRSKFIAAKTSYRTARSAYDNINAAEAALSQSLEVLKSTDSAQELIQKKKSFAALNILNDLRNVSFIKEPTSGLNKISVTH
jgi:hypothetical protein